MLSIDNILQIDIFGGTVFFYAMYVGLLCFTRLHALTDLNTIKLIDNALISET
jgi:hypothetical protein